MRVFITGGTGFLGYNTILDLLQNGHDVIALVRQDNSILSTVQNPRLQLIKGSLDGEVHYDTNEIIDACVHFAWGGVNRNGVNDGEIQKQNVKNTLNLISFLINHNCKLLIDAGSRQEYAPTSDPITEDTICKPVSEYGKWKLEAFHSACNILHSKMKYVHLRIFSTYGVGDHPWSLLNTSIDKMMKNEPLELGLCRHFWSFLFIDDFTNLICSILKKINKINGIEIFNVGSGFVQPLRYFVNTIKQVVNSESELNYGKFIENIESKSSLIPDISKANKVFGWNEKYTFEQGIKIIIKNKHYD